MNLTRAEKIRIYTKRKGINLEILFLKSGLKSRQLGNYKLMSNTFKDEEIKKIANVLGVKVEDLKGDYYDV